MFIWHFSKRTPGRIKREGSLFGCFNASDPFGRQIKMEVCLNSYVAFKYLPSLPTTLFLKGRCRCLCC